MSLIKIGSTDGMSLSQFKLRKTRGTDGLWALAYEFRCREDQAESLAPAHNAACTETGHESLKCRRVDIDPVLNTDMATVQIEYMHPESSSSLAAKTAGDSVKEITASKTEAPVTDPRFGFNAVVLAQYRAERIAAIAYPLIEYSLFEWVNSFTWSEANAVDNIGQREGPDGLSGATANMWLLTGRDVRQVGTELIEKRRTWSYDYWGWDTRV